MGTFLLIVFILAVVYVGVGILVKFVNCLGRGDRFKLGAEDIIPVLSWPKSVFGG